MLSCLTYQDSENSSYLFPIGVQKFRNQEEEATGLRVRVWEKSGIQIHGKRSSTRPKAKADAVRTEAEEQRCMRSGLWPTQLQGDPCTV